MVAIAIDSYLQSHLEGGWWTRRKWLAELRRAKRVAKKLGLPESQWREEDWS
jgi:predicted DNA-binding ArsR family transcriptional regulator